MDLQYSVVISLDIKKPGAKQTSALESILILFFFLPIKSMLMAKQSKFAANLPNWNFP